MPIEPLKRVLLDERLPRTACTKQMASEVYAVSQKKDISEAAVIRHAVSIYLSTLSPEEKVLTPEELEIAASKEASSD